MKIISLSSGSKGNVTLVKTNEMNILIDVGLSMKKINELLMINEGIDLDDIDLILITHSHSDHIMSAHTIYNAYKHIEFIMNDDVYQNILHKLKDVENDRIEIFDVGEYFYEHISVNPFELEHDVPTIGFHIYEYATDESFVFIADNGMLPYRFRDEEWLKNHTYYMIESNYDTFLQYTDTTRNELLKRRVLSYKGHSCNFNAIEKACMLVGEDTKGVMFHHLSEHCNNEDLAIESHNAYIGVWGKKTQFKGINIKYAKQNEVVKL